MDGDDATQVRLIWPGKDDAVTSPSARLEPVRGGGLACRLVQGDNLAAMRALSKRPEQRQASARMLSMQVVHALAGL